MMTPKKKTFVSERHKGTKTINHFSTVDVLGWLYTFRLPAVFGALK